MEDEMGWAYSMHENMRNAYKILVWKLGRNHL